MQPPPVATSLRGYQRRWLTLDLVAATTLLAIAIPEQLATARLAGMAPIITGFLGGIAVVIVVHQLPDLLGVSGGGSTTLGRLHAVTHELGAVHWWALAIGLGVFAVVYVSERLDRRAPGALAALAASTAIVAVAGLRHHGVTVLGHVAHGAPSPALYGLTLGDAARLAPVAGIVALVVVTQTAATARAFAQRGGYDVDVGKDLLGVGAGCALAGLVGAFPVNASPPRTAAVADAGGRTRISAQPKLHVLGRIPGSTSWAPVSSAQGAAQLPGVLVVLFPTPLWFANANHFRDELEAAVERCGTTAPSLVVLDALGMTDVDFTGAEVLRGAIEELARGGTRFAVARAEPDVRAELRRGAVAPALIPDGYFFPAVDEAVTALLGQGAAGVADGSAGMASGSAGVAGGAR